MIKKFVSIVLIGVLLSVALVSYTANASTPTIWYQNDKLPEPVGYYYKMYVNSSVSYSNKIQNNYISLSIDIDTVTQTTNTEEVFIYFSAIGYSNVTTQQVDEGSNSGYEGGPYVITSYKPYEIKILATQNNVPSDVGVQFENVYDAGVNVSGNEYKGDSVTQEMENLTEFAAE